MTDNPHLLTRAYAKINLGLNILGKRSDGYHDIETVFYPVNIFDDIELKAYDQVMVSCSHPDVPVDSTNLCVRAANALRAHFRIPDGVHISLQKSIPIGAGLGGGSSDAAAVLLGLRELWNLRISDDALRSIAASIGSDVAYFLQPTAAYATGRGEILDYFDFTLPYWTVVVFPDIHVSTAWAYNRLKVQPLEPVNLKQFFLKNKSRVERWENQIKNDFEPVVFPEYPEIEEVKTRLLNTGAAYALMSGSGSAVYGLFTSNYEADDAVEMLSGAYQVFSSPPNFLPDFFGNDDLTM